MLGFFSVVTAICCSLFACLNAVSHFLGFFSSSVIAAGIAVWAFQNAKRITQLEEAAAERARIARRQEKGLMEVPAVLELVTDHRAFDSTKADWVEGEPKMILVGDRVIRWNGGISVGLAVLRNTKIVAVETKMYFTPWWLGKNTSSFQQR